MNINNTFKDDSKYFQTMTLIGSTKFRDIFYESAKIFTMRGFIVTMPHIFSNNEDEDIFDNELSAFTKEEKINILKRMGFQRIYEADVVYYINPKLYIGMHTLAELLYAEYLGKHIMTLCKYEINGSTEYKKLYNEYINKRKSLFPGAIKLLNEYKPYLWDYNNYNEKYNL